MFLRIRLFLKPGNASEYSQAFAQSVSDAEHESSIDGEEADLKPRRMTRTVGQDEVPDETTDPDCDGDGVDGSVETSFPSRERACRFHTGHVQSETHRPG